MRRTKGKIKQNAEDNYLERMVNMISGSGSFSGESSTNATEKTKKIKASGTMEEGKEITLSKKQKNEAREQEEKLLKIEAGIDYAREIAQAGEKASNHENKELEAQLKEIMAEIKKLADSSKELQLQFREVAVEQYIVKPGKYHKSFFSWLLSIIRAARAKVEDSNAWLQAMHSKKKSREYTAMAKKQGTSFTLNNERTVATQVG